MSELILSILRGHVIHKTSLKSLRAISTTSALLAEPPRKKRRLDPAVLKVRVERKIRRHEREIQQIESEPKQLIPILEYQITSKELRELNSRPQHTMDEFGITPNLLKGARRLWAIYRSEQSTMEYESIRKVQMAQDHALYQLKDLDDELYKRTVEVDDTVLIPYRSDHMRRETPFNPNYIPPDGYIKDTTKDYVM